MSYCITSGNPKSCSAINFGVVSSTRFIIVFFFFSPSSKSFFRSVGSVRSPPRRWRAGKAKRGGKRMKKTKIPASVLAAGGARENWGEGGHRRSFGPDTRYTRIISHRKFVSHRVSLLLFIVVILTDNAYAVVSFVVGRTRRAVTFTHVRGRVKNAFHTRPLDRSERWVSDPFVDARLEAWRGLSEGGGYADRDLIQRGQEGYDMRHLAGRDYQIRFRVRLGRDRAESREMDL